jgi:hypothetical protein
MESFQERIRRAELGRVAEQARAEEARRTAAEAEAKVQAERRARRLTAALAASVLALTAWGSGSLPGPLGSGGNCLTGQEY